MEMRYPPQKGFIHTHTHTYIYICWKVSFSTTFLTFQELQTVPPQELETVPSLEGPFSHNKNGVLRIFVTHFGANSCFLGFGTISEFFFIHHVSPNFWPLFKKPFFRKFDKIVCQKHYKNFFGGCFFSNLRKPGSLIEN